MNRLKNTLKIFGCLRNIFFHYLIFVIHFITHSFVSGAVKRIIDSCLNVLLIFASNTFCLEMYLDATCCDVMY